MITFDGDRSKRRKWFAEKQLRVIKDLGLPAKALAYDGFTIRVHQQDELEGGRITAPMGLIVCRSTLDGAEMFVADYWLSGFNYRVPLNVLFQNSLADVTTTLIFRASEEDMIAAGFSTVPCRPVEYQSPYGLTDGTTIGPSTVWVSDQNPTIGLGAFLGEGYYATPSASLFVDLNGNGTADFPKTVVEYFLNFYNSPGTNLGGRTSFHLETGRAFEQPLRCLFGTTEGYLEHQVAGYEAVGGNIICGRRITCDVTAGPTLTNVLASTLWAGVPSGLRTILLDPEIQITHYPAGGYAFGAGPKFLHGVNATNRNPYWPSSDLETWFIANPSEEKWRLFYTISDGVSVNIVNSDDFLTLLDTLATVPVITAGPSVNWENARRMFQQLFPWPNVNFVAPYDSIMFNDSASVYTWTRAYGAVKFTTTGIVQQTMHLPTEVTSTNGVRPDLVHCGTFEVAPDPPFDFFVCMCNDVGVEIQAVYVGTPFEGTHLGTDYWAALPSIPTGHKLLYARVMGATLTEVTLLGVVEQDAVGEVLAQHRACYLRALLDENLGWTGEWRLLSYLPTAVEGGEIFTATTFGVGKGTQDMVNFITRPHALPQMPVGPYDKYAIGMP